MPPTRQDRTPERTEGIAVELTEFGLWIEVHDQPGGWQGAFLSARALRRLVALPAEERLAALATLDPAGRAARQPGRRRDEIDAGDASPARLAAGQGPGVGRGSHLGSDHAPSLHHHKE